MKLLVVGKSYANASEDQNQRYIFTNLPSMGCCGTRTRQTISAWSALPILRSASISTRYFALKANLDFHVARIFCLLSSSQFAFILAASTSALESPRWGATFRHESRNKAMSLLCSLEHGSFSWWRVTPTSTHSSSRVTPDMLCNEMVVQF